MKQYINLYSEELRPKKETLPLAQVVAAMIVSVLIMSSVITYLVIDKQSLQQQVERLQNKQKQQQSTLAELSKMAKELRPDQTLLLNVESLKMKHKNFERLLSKLQQERQQKSAIYDQVMRELAQIDSTNVWLSGIAVGHNYLDLHGFVANEGALSQWLNRFKQADLLKGRQFSVLDMEHQDDHSWMFSLKAQAKPRAAGSD